MSSPAIAEIVNSKDVLFSNHFGIDKIFNMIKIVHKQRSKPEADDFRRNPITYLLNGLPEALREDEEKSEEVKGRIRVLAELQNMYSDSYSNFSVLSPERNRVWEHFMDNTITRVITSINKAENWQELTRDAADPNGIFKHMRWLGEDNNPLSKFSKLLGSIFDLDPMSPTYGEKKEKAKLVISNIAGTQVVSNKPSETTGVSTASMDGTSKYLQEFHTMLLNGVEEFMRHASKNTAQ
jgi:inorganic triphosphatase YgiF